jgi:hypothetical protein
MATSMNMAVFWDDAPRSLVDIDRRFRGAVKLIALMMEAAKSYETSLDIHQTTRCNIPEGSHILLLW